MTQFKRAIAYASICTLFVILVMFYMGWVSAFGARQDMDWHNLAINVLWFAPFGALIGFLWEYLPN